MTKAEEYRERVAKIAGFDVFLASYKIGKTFHCVVSNESTRGNLVRTRGVSREEAERLAMENAKLVLTGRNG